MRQTDVSQTNIRQHHHLMPRLLGAGHNKEDGETQKLSNSHDHTTIDGYSNVQSQTRTSTLNDSKISGRKGQKRNGRREGSEHQ